MDKKLIEIYLSGGDIFPGKVRSKELAEILESVEEMISSIVVRDNPELTQLTILFEGRLDDELEI